MCCSDEPRSPAERVRYILSDDKTHVSSDKPPELALRGLFCQMDALCHFDTGDTGWKEAARYVLHSSLCLSVCLSVVHSSLCLSVCLWCIPLYVCLSVVHSSLCLSVCGAFLFMSVCLWCIPLYVCLSVVHSSLCLSVCGAFVLSSVCPVFLMPSVLPTSPFLLYIFKFCILMSSSSVFFCLRVLYSFVFEFCILLSSSSVFFCLRVLYSFVFNFRFRLLVLHSFLLNSFFFWILFSFWFVFLFLAFIACCRFSRC